MTSITYPVNHHTQPYKLTTLYIREILRGFVFRGTDTDNVKRFVNEYF
jgi:hypothetical protein